MSSQRLLVVDDEVQFGEFVRKVAVRLGFTVEVTADARSFQKAYKDLKPTKIVLDIVMPDMDGIELVEWLAEQGCDAGLIIITGYSPDYAINAGKLAQFKGFQSVTTLTKPVRLPQLRAALS